MERNIFKILAVLAAALLVVSLLPIFGNTPQNQKPPQKNPEKVLMWREVIPAAPFAPRDSHASFIFQNKIFLIGGINGNGLVDAKHFIPYWQAPHFNDIWFSEDGERWNKAESENIWPPRRSMSTVLFREKLWMMGGWSPATGYSRDLWQSEDGVNWTKVDIKLPWEPREGQSVEVFDGKIWLLGGVNYDRRKVFNDVWYSQDGLDWKEANSTALWAGRWDHALALHDGKFFLAGGMDLKNKVYSDVWSSPDGEHWSLLTDAPGWEARQGHSAFSFDGKLWIMGRLNDDKINPGPNDVWSSPDGIVWKKEGDLPWDGREDFTAVILNDKIYVIGGMGNDWTWRNDVWEAELKMR